MPSASPVTGTGNRSSALSRAATGRSRADSTTLPLGRPRWLIRTTLAPPSSRWRIVGTAARTRESSLTLPSSMGTLKSTRTRTRLPAGSKSRTVSLSISGGAARRLRGAALAEAFAEALADVRHEIGDAAAVAPLVVIPGDDLDHPLADDHRRQRVDDRRAVVALVVHRDERLVADAEDALHGVSLGRPEG